MIKELLLLIKKEYEIIMYYKRYVLLQNVPQVSPLTVDMIKESL